MQSSVDPLSILKDRAPATKWHDQLVVNNKNEGECNKVDTFFYSLMYASHFGVSLPKGGGLMPVWIFLPITMVHYHDDDIGIKQEFHKIVILFPSFWSFSIYHQDSGAHHISCPCSIYYYPKHCIRDYWWALRMYVPIQICAPCIQVHLLPFLIPCREYCIPKNY